MILLGTFDYFSRRVASDPAWGGTMARAQRRRGAAGRVVLVAALTLAGAGAGAAAVLAVSGSGLIRAAGGAAGGAAGLGSAVWADAARQRREAVDAAVRARGQVLDPVVSEPAQDRSVLGLLLPTRESAAPFRGRVADLAWLQAWCDNPDSHPVALVTGPGGAGKTRLVTQFAVTRPPPWASGWLHPGRGASALAAVGACGDPALILVDDADASPDAVALLGDLAGQPRGAAVRVVLITRTTGALAQVAGQLPESARWLTALENLPVRTAGPFGSTKVTAWRERRRLAAAQAGTTVSPADTSNPVTMARVTGAELLRMLRAEADRVSGIADRLREAVETVTDPTAAEAEVEAVRAAAEQRAAVAEARAAAAEQRAAQTDQWRAEADAAAEEMAAEMTAAQARADQAEAARAAAEADRDTAAEAARQDAAARIAAAEADRDAAIEQARAEASQQVSGAEADRDQARHLAAEAEQATRLAQQEASRAQAAAEAARAESGRVRADAEKMLASFRADAARDRDELRADLRARAERAERQADAYRDELAQLRAGTSHDTDITTSSRTPRRARPTTQP
jgi:colicin import membrane protein